jgi:hypothetical protein
MMGTPSGVNLTELRGPFLGLCGVTLGGLSAGCDGATRAGGDSGSAAATGAAGGGVTSTAAVEGEPR